MSWQPLCDSNPIPGDPEGVAKLAGDLACVASDLREQTLTLQRISSDDFWEGEAADQFREHQTKLPPYLSQLATRYEKVSDALGAYHPELHEAQQEAYRALQKAREAEQNICNGERRVQEMNQWISDEQNRVNTWNAQNPKQPPLSPQGWDYSRGGDPVGELQSAHAALGAARRELVCAIERYEDAARTCANRIEDAIDDDLKNESGLLALGKKIFEGMLGGLLTLKNLAAALEALSVIFAAIGLVLALAGVLPAAEVFFALSAVATVLKFAVTVELYLRGEADLGDVAEDFAWAVLAVSTLGIGMLAKAGKLGKYLKANNLLIDAGATGFEWGWKIGSWLRRRLDPEPETRPRCDLVPRPCIYRPPACPKPALEVEHPPGPPEIRVEHGAPPPEIRVEHGAPPPEIRVEHGATPQRMTVQGTPSPRDVAVLHRVKPGGVVAASPQPTADVILQGS